MQLPDALGAVCHRHMVMVSSLGASTCSDNPHANSVSSGASHLRSDSCTVKALATGHRASFLVHDSNDGKGHPVPHESRPAARPT